MRQINFVTSLTLAAVLGTGAMANQVSIDQIGAIWSNPTGSAVDLGNVAIENGDGNPAVGGETVTIEWGVAAGDGGQSGYEFNPEDVSYIADPDTPQLLGTFTHFNNPIFTSGGFVDTVDLVFEFAGTPLGFGLPPALASFGATFNFFHDETSNEDEVGDCGSSQTSGTPCDDIVTVAAVGGASETIVVDVPGEKPMEYTFTLLGFSTDHGTTFANEFVTEEGQINTAELYFDYSVSVVPLPAAGWLLLAGLGGLAAVGRRRKSA